ncbi:MAG TPA: ferredoxin [Streptosporangiaceae bacterium]|nr:ferredoxin [Streptosporangiaceae bacterium]
MKVSIDLDKCCGHARCHAVDSELFLLDDGGYALRPEIDIPPGAEGKARRAVTSCPEGAIRETAS